MKERIKLQEGIGLEEGLNIRRCSECGKPLAEVNPGPECYSCRLSEVAGIGKYEKVIKFSTTFGVMNPATLESSLNPPEKDLSFPQGDEIACIL